VRYGGSGPRCFVWLRVRLQACSSYFFAGLPLRPVFRRCANALCLVFGDGAAVAFTAMLSWSQIANSSVIRSIPLINRRFLLCRCSSTLPLYLTVITRWLPGLMTSPSCESCLIGCRSTCCPCLQQRREMFSCENGILRSDAFALRLTRNTTKTAIVYLAAFFNLAPAINTTVKYLGLGLRSSTQFFRTHLLFWH
jgi:hypothetical protein